MKKKFFALILFILLIINFKTFADTSSDVKKIYEGKENAKVTIIFYESLTCGHCADFHKNIYPD